MNVSGALKVVVGGALMEQYEGGVLPLSRQWLRWEQNSYNNKEQ
jgi:hypothetical protein